MISQTPKRIHIRHCRLRVVRKGGWAWSTNPRALARDLVRLLPKLLAESFSNFPATSEASRHFEMSNPLKVNIRVSPGELRQLISGVSAASFDPSHRIRDALKQSISSGSVVSTSSPAAQDPPREQSSPLPHTTFPRTDSGGSPLQFLQRIHTAGLLTDVLEQLSERAIWFWHQQVFESSEVAIDPMVQSSSPQDASPRRLPIESSSSPSRVDNDEGPRPPKDWQEQARAMAARFPVSGAEFTDTLRLRILMACEIAQSLSLSPSTPELLTIVDQAIQLPESATTLEQCSEHESEPHATPADSPPDPKVSSTLTHSTVVTPPVSTKTVIQVDSALPWLLLPSLQQIGYLDALTAAFETSNRLAMLPAFAAAFACKLLEPPERGWRRSVSAQITAAAFAGSTEPIDNSRLVQLSRIADEFVPLLTATIDATLDPAPSGLTHPLILTRFHSTETYLVGDATRAEPYFAGHLEECLEAPLWKTLHSVDAGGDPPIVLVHQSAMDASTLTSLDSRGIVFLTGSPPGRGENWRRLRSGRLWTNVKGFAGDRRLLRAGEQLETASEAIQSVWQQLHIDRQAVLRAESPQLETCLSLTVARTLGQLADKLWGEREPVDPCLALERFGDLSARVEFERECLRVVLPLGRRSEDLHQHGLLEERLTLPWLPGRIVTLCRG